MKGRWRRIFAVAMGVVAAVFVARARLAMGVVAAVATVDALMVAGGVLCLPRGLMRLLSCESADGLAYAAKQAVGGILPFGKRGESYRDYKRRRGERRTKKEGDAFPLFVGGALCLLGGLMAILL